MNCDWCGKELEEENVSVNMKHFHVSCFRVYEVTVLQKGYKSRDMFRYL